jgi:protein phosphatase
MNIDVPELCLVVLVGVSGSGKSTFASRHFRATEVVSSDVCRGLVADDPNDQGATTDAFDVLHYIAGKRLRRRKLVVIDATNVQVEARASLLRLAREHDCLAVAIVLDVPPEVANERNAKRPDREFGMRVIMQQRSQLHRGLRGLSREGFSRVHVLRTLEEIDSVEIRRQRLWNDRTGEHGPFDIIGDVHGCYAELVELLEKLGYRVGGTREQPQVQAPEDRRVVFVGDLVDRGPDSPGVLRLAMAMHAAGSAICVPGNHEIKLLRKLRGKNVKLTHGLAQTMEQLEREPASFHAEVASFIDGLISHFVLDDGRLVVAHAGLKEAYQGRTSGRVRSFCLFGETTGETDEFGLPIRYDWASEYRGPAMVVYGHTPVPEARWINRTICIDTGCVFGGKLTALRYPERELVDVGARETYYEPVRPLAAPTDERPRDLLEIADVAGKRIVETRVRHTVTVREENASAALEVMSRFAVDPRWLVYLPPTMSPPETAPAGSPLLERPQEAFDHYARNGIERVVCEEKHMGSRAVIVAARHRSAAQARFAVGDDKQGVIFTRTGRPFFGDAALEQIVVERISTAFERAGLWDELETPWVCLDAEIMPWSFKAEELVRQQYAPVGAAGRAALAAAVESLSDAIDRGSSALLERYRARQRCVDDYDVAWRRYCWGTNGLDGVRVAPFHLLATEGRTYFDRSHLWHMQQLARLEREDDLFLATPHRVVELGDETSRAGAIAWWEQLTDSGGEGMVVKPELFVSTGKRGLVQPAIKCRGREYLRIIYGPEYDLPDNIERLRERGLSTKRSLAMREFALGVEALHRVTEGEPLWRVHECVFAILAMESEPVDPRL